VDSFQGFRGYFHGPNQFPASLNQRFPNLGDFSAAGRMQKHFRGCPVDFRSEVIAEQKARVEFQRVKDAFFREPGNGKDNDVRRLVAVRVPGRFALLFKKRKRDGKRPLDEGFHDGIHGVMKKRGGQDDEIAVPVFREYLPGHIVFVKANARGFGPAGKASDAVPDFFSAQFDDLHLRAGFAHPLEQIPQDDFGFADVPCPGAGIKSENFHESLLVF